MNYNETLQSVELVLQADEVPLLVGATGIGKTTMAKELAQRHNWTLITIDGNLLKEGEIGGLPKVEGFTTVYARHYKMQQIENMTDVGKPVLVFIDELNRCEHAVQQELMNLILNREINGFTLDKKVRLIGAMNPSDGYDYQTVEMDKAQENRFVWLYMETDYLQWLEWAIKANVEPEIREFIATYPDYLQRKNEDVDATPRSYERISKLYHIYKNNSEQIPQAVFFNVLVGNVGKVIATELLNFLKGDYKPIIKYAEVFATENLSPELRERVATESPTRLYLTLNNMLQEMEQKITSGGKNAADFIDRLVEFLGLYPVDLRIALMKNIRNNTEHLSKAALENDKFIEAYFNAQGIHNA